MHDLSPFEHIISTSTDQLIQQGRATNRLRMSITFADSSILHIRENYVIATDWVDYSYHWQTATYQLIHRWDNAHEVPLPTSPYHQHIGSEENIQASEPMTLEKVLRFIDNLINPAESPEQL